MTASSWNMAGGSRLVSRSSAESFPANSLCNLLDAICDRFQQAVALSFPLKTVSIRNNY
jgi:hypothetical protein